MRVPLDLPQLTQIRACIKCLTVGVSQQAMKELKALRRYDVYLSDTVYLAPGEDKLSAELREARGAETLLLEIIRRAAYDWVLYKTSVKTDHQNLAQEAFTWLFVEDEQHSSWALRVRDGRILTSFVGICRALGMDPDRIREHIMRLTPNKVMAAGRSRSPRTEMIKMTPRSSR